MTDELKAAALEIAEREQTYGVAGDLYTPAESGESQRAGAAEIPNTAGASATPPRYNDANYWRTRFKLLDAENKRLREALQKAVDDYGKPGGPWNVPNEPGCWIELAKAALAGGKEQS